MSEEIRDVPTHACHLSLGEVTIGDNGDDAKTAPFAMVARSGKPIDHPYWGRVVHDLSGMQLERNRVAIDFCHDAKEIIGFANKFDIESGDLEARGALIPYAKEGDRATEVIEKAKLGVPWEASINFGGTGIVVEQVDEGDSAEVNGYEFKGPGVVVRQWPLRGIAVCPYGADQYTSTEFANSESNHKVTIMKKENLFEQSQGEEVEVVDASIQAFAAPAEEAELAAPRPGRVEEEEEAVEAEAPVEEAVEVEAEEDTVEAEAVEAPAVETELSRAEEGKMFMDAFGAEKGAQYFALGTSFKDATIAHMQFQAEKIADLETRLSASPASDGEPEAVEFSEKVEPVVKESIIRFN